MNGVTREGYTFQTALGSMGLNHMNGRIEDAIVGRFLSADPYPSEPDLTQGWNRYSYVNNNPLTYVDPSGFDCEFQDLTDGTVVYFPCGNPTAPPAAAGPPVHGSDGDGAPSPGGGGGGGKAPPKKPPSDSLQEIIVEAQRLPCPSASGPTNDGTSVPFTDDSGNPILDNAGNPMQRPGGFDPHYFTSQGAADGQAQGALNLPNFRIGGPYDAQRIGGANQSNFVDFANVAIGLYASGAGLSQPGVLSVANGYAAVKSNFVNQPMDPIYTHLRAANVFDIKLGFSLQQSGAICTRH
jgi:RHS repeat-associated protein